ncbi:hypothetical protein GGX14DRAFT_643183 [Mycena pura]|uniref:Uncharacterized protein n=1 Tax=Mycena pura TaxID=153505 RepID=A0AAD6V9S4_9AGAR|nr:hypothetical protein GGX14DRAFT_643183 [Mycena pura]
MPSQVVPKLTGSAVPAPNISPYAQIAGAWRDHRVAMDSSAVSCLEANPDISGLGVRISFYLQTIALVLLAGRSLDEALSSVWTLLGTSFGLAISAFVSAVRDELPLYQATIVTDLIWLANYAIFMALATYNRHPRGSHSVQYCAILQTYVSMSCMLYLWARAAALEAVGHAAAGHTVFVFVFASLPATGAGRTVALVFTVLLLAGYTGVASLFLWRHLLQPRPPISKGSPPPPSPQQPRHPPIALQPLLLLPPPPASPRTPSESGSSRLHAHAPGPPARAPPSLKLDPHLTTLSLFFGVPYVVLVVCTEIQIARNTLCPANKFWGFGQILAMTVTIVPVVITVQAFRKYGWKQRPRVIPGSSTSVV